MIVINGMPLNDNLVNFLKGCYESQEGARPETVFDNDIEAMLELNDYLIEHLTFLPTNDIEEIQKLSLHLINVKVAKDRMKQLSALLKECREEGEEES